MNGTVRISNFKGWNLGNNKVWNDLKVQSLKIISQMILWSKSKFLDTAPSREKYLEDGTPGDVNYKSGVEHLWYHSRTWNEWATKVNSIAAYYTTVQDWSSSCSLVLKI